MAPLLERVGPMFEEAGIAVTGSATKNHWRLSPVGVFKPAWLTLDEMVSLSDLSAMPWRKVAIVNIKGYLDFFPRFLAVALEKRRQSRHGGSDREGPCRSARELDRASRR